VTLSSASNRAIQQLKTLKKIPPRIPFLIPPSLLHFFSTLITKKEKTKRNSNFLSTNAWKKTKPHSKPHQHDPITSQLPISRRKASISSPAEGKPNFPTPAQVYHLQAFHEQKMHSITKSREILVELD